MVDLRLQLPEHFLAEETRCDYVVSSEMKEVWAVLLDLFVEFARVCKKHNINYFASGGTMLGAVRHKGFIPWDDDIDIMMFRADYDKLQVVGPTEFKHPYFFQSKYTDPCSGCFFSKLRNSETTAIAQEERNSKLEFNRGIFIDIFPLDNIPDDEEEFALFAKRADTQKQVVYRAGRKLGIFSDSSKPIVKFLKNTMALLLKQKRERHIDKFISEFSKLEDICRTYSHQKTTMCMPLLQSTDKKHKKYVADYIETIDMDFEFLKMPVGKQYDHGLRHYFGDYMKFVKGTSLHGGLLFDTDNSYHNSALSK